MCVAKNLQIPDKNEKLTMFVLSFLQFLFFFLLLMTSFSFSTLCNVVLEKKKKHLITIKCVPDVV